MIVQQSDFKCVGDVAVHCDLSKLCIAINEAEEFDLSSLFCDFWPTIVKINTEVSEYKTLLAAYNKCIADEEPDCIVPNVPENYEIKNSLINGGNYTSCNGKTKNHLGVKRILVYYSYARYCIINNFNDTPNGAVSKTNDFSIPKSIKELESFSNKYRTMGFESYKKTLDFICHNKEVFTDTNCLDCEICGCDCDKCGVTKAKGYGIRGRNITRRI